MAPHPELMQSLETLIQTVPQLDSVTAAERYRQILETVNNPRDLDDALRALGAREKGVNAPDFPGYPEALGTPIWDNKTHPVHEAAAAISRPLREAEFLNNRWEPPKQGSFAAIVLPDSDVPEASKIFITERSANVGAGKGFPGGLLEDFEIQAGERRPLRELSEELSEITGRSEQEIAANLEPLKPYFQHVTSYDDPRHYLVNGAGKNWSARAHPHTLVAPPQSDAAATEAYAYLRGLLNQSIDSQQSGHETNGAAFVTAAELPTILDQFTYPHEALGAIIAAQKEIQKIHPDFNLVQSIKEQNPQALETLTKRMHGQAGQNVEELARHVEERAQGKKLTVVTTDFGADCDDQLAVTNLIESMGHNDEIAFVVNGPHPHAAAAAIAQKYHDATGHYPLIAAGTQFGQDKIPEDKIYSLVDGKPMSESVPSVEIRPVSLEKFQQAIDEKLQTEAIGTFEQIVLAPLQSDLEYYHPNRGQAANPALENAWGAVTKLATTQFQLENGRFLGNNYVKSNQDVADGYVNHLAEQGFEAAYFDGAVAKRPEFMMTVEQPELPGVQKAAETYLEFKQVPWLNLTGNNGATPSVDEMHAGMFTGDALFPFSQHTSGTHKVGFGAQRIMKEVCGLEATNPAHGEGLQKIQAELDHFDEQVLTEFKRQHPDTGIETVNQMRAEMHAAMMGAFTDIARSKGLIGPEEKLHTISELFDRAEAKGTPLNAAALIPEFSAALSSSSSIIDITDIAAREKDKPRENGATFVGTMAALLGETGARAVMYDAVAVEFSHAVLHNPEAKEYFREEGGKLNITPDRVTQIQQDNPELFAKIQQEVVNGLKKGGGQMAITEPTPPTVVDEITRGYQVNGPNKGIAR